MSMSRERRSYDARAHHLPTSAHFFLVALTAIVDFALSGTWKEETPLNLYIRALVEVCETSDYHLQSVALRP